MRCKDEQEILTLISCGNPDGLKSLFDLYYKPLCIFAMNFLDSFGESEDIVQDLFVKFWEKYKDKQFEGSLRAYFFNANYVKESTLIKFLAFGGKEKTYQAWYGIEDPEKLRNDRTFNPAGMYFDEFGNMKFYNNETDNYWQNHFQLHWTEKWSENWISNAALHYTIGKMVEDISYNNAKNFFKF
jgi:hypothetical protein